MLVLEIRNHYSGDLAEAMGRVDTVNPVMGVVINRGDENSPAYVECIYAAPSAAVIKRNARQDGFIIDSVIDIRESQAVDG